MDLAWKLADLPKPTGPSVLSCFHCGGGSSMGYKLAGCNVLGGVEIDRKMMALYRANLHPVVSFLSDIRTAPVPSQRIDILDGSPPCSTFSCVGLREKAWGQERAYKEGGAKQRMDDLFFAFIDYAEKVKPKIVVAENVRGMLFGNARAYVLRVKQGFERIGYRVQLFQLAASDFGVPQARERIFFVAHHLNKPLVISTPKHFVTIREALRDVDVKGRPLRGIMKSQWLRTHRGRTFKPAGGSFGTVRVNPDGLAPTLFGSSRLTHWDEPCELSHRAFARLQSFPDDYDFGRREVRYVCGMSVPPLLMHGLATQLIAQAF
jgi:DNA (cytosine-5)-methyltransferase 1